jgi:hypothetical protein
MKICTKCKVEKDLSEFPNDNRYGRTRKKSCCKKCKYSLYKKKYYQTEEGIKSRKKYSKEYLQRPYVKEKRRNYQKYKLATDIQYKLYSQMRKYIYRSLRGNSKDLKTIEYLGYTPTQLKLRIECQFDDNMSWSNYGKLWEIDHKKPINKFKDINPRLVNMLCNLQPMLISENRSKRDFFN